MKAFDPTSTAPSGQDRPFVEIDHRAVDTQKQLLDVPALRGGRIEHPSAVEMQQKTMLARDRLDGPLMVEVHHGPGAAVVRVLQPDQPCTGVMDVRSTDGRLERLRQDVTAV